MDRWLNILLVDDDEDDYVLTRAMLEEIKRDKFRLDWESDYDDALESMCVNRHDAYLLDYRLGERNGIDLLRDAIEAGCTAPIIFLTGQGAPEVDVQAMQSGAAEYLVKGNLTPQLLERTIRYAIEHKQIERELAEARERVARSREEERLRLAQELHDGPVQDLYGVRFQLKSLLKTIETTYAPQIEDLQAELQHVTNTLRSICGELRPPTLAPFGLDVAIRSHADRFKERHPDLEMELDLASDGRALPEEMRHALYRIYQHGVSNVSQHAGAGAVRVRLEIEDNSVVLEIQDDGSGFEVPHRWTQLARHGHLGLLGASERAESIGGYLEVQSEPGEGTLVRVTAPLPVEDGEVKKYGK